MKKLDVPTSSTSINVIVSDLYGVQLKRDETVMLSDFRQISALPEADVAFAIKNAGREALKVGSISVEQYVRELNLQLGTKLSVPEVREIWNRSLAVNKPMVALLRKLEEKGFVVILLSNLNAFDWQDAATLGLSGFERVLSYEVGMKKPDPRIFQLALTKTGMPAESHLYIDDQQRNVDVAESLGMKALRFTSYEKLLQSLAEYEVHVNID